MQLQETDDLAHGGPQVMADDPEKPGLGLVGLGKMPVQLVELVVPFAQHFIEFLLIAVDKIKQQGNDTQGRQPQYQQ